MSAHPLRFVYQCSRAVLDKFGVTVGAEDFLSRGGDEFIIGKHRINVAVTAYLNGFATRNFFVKRREITLSVAQMDNHIRFGMVHYCGSHFVGRAV
jgi:hypothetical protein